MGQIHVPSHCRDSKMTITEGVTRTMIVTIVVGLILPCCSHR